MSFRWKKAIQTKISRHNDFAKNCRADKLGRLENTTQLSKELATTGTPMRTKGFIDNALLTAL